MRGNELFKGGIYHPPPGDTPTKRADCSIFVPLFVECFDGNQLKPLIFIFSEHLMFMCSSVFECKYLLLLLVTSK